MTFPLICSRIHQHQCQCQRHLPQARQSFRSEDAVGARERTKEGHKLMDRGRAHS